jgi:serine/threonine protein kinase
MLDVGERVREYTLKRFLGSGTFGDVWLAEKELELSDEGILFALKFLHGQSGADINNENIRSELNTWIKAGNHSNIVRVFDGFVHGRHLVIVSEYIEGGSLRDWLVANFKRAPSLAAAVEMMRGILRGLSHLHARKIIHRDLKPENILLEDGVPKITDFGVSRMVETFSQSGARRSTGAAGSPAYMPPEAFSDGPPLPQGDIWSAGVIFYEMLSGDWPFNGQSMYALFAEITGKDPRPLPRDVPGELRTIVTTALSKDAGQRFQTAEKMLGALGRAWAKLQQGWDSLSETIRNEEGPEGERRKREAEGETEQIPRHAPEEAETVEDQSSAEVFIERGNTYYKQKDYDSAVQNYSKAIELNPRDANAYSSRGNAYYMKGDHDQAFADYNKALALDSTLPHVYINRGNIYYEEGERDQALIDFNRAIQVDSQNATAYYRRGRFYASAYYDYKNRDAGDYDRAMRDFNKATRLNPRYAQAYSDRGYLYYYKGNYEQAFMDYNKAIESNPKYAEAYTNRGLAYRVHHKYDQALADYNKAIELSPKNAGAYTYRGLVYEEQGDNDQAIADYTKAIEVAPQNAYAYERRGLAYAKKGDYERAIDDCNKVIELKPKDAFAYSKRSAVYKGLQKRAKTLTEWWNYRKSAKADSKKFTELLLKD